MGGRREGGREANGAESRSSVLYWNDFAKRLTRSPVPAVAAVAAAAGNFVFFVQIPSALRLRHHIHMFEPVWCSLLCELN